MTTAHENSVSLGHALSFSPGMDCTGKLSPHLFLLTQSLDGEHLIGGAQGSQPSPSLNSAFQFRRQDCKPRI